MTPTRRRRRRLLLLTVSLLAAAQAATGLLLVGHDRSADVRAYPSDTVDLAGHGFGHGRGMGQFGALGYAVDHGWSYQQILDHFYGGTHLASDLGNPPISVRLTARDGQPMIVTQEQRHMTTSVTGGTTFGGVMVSRDAGLYRVLATSDGSPRCDGGPAPGWQQVATSATPVTVSPTADTTPLVPYDQSTNQRQEMLQLCLPNGTRWYRGSLQAVADGGGVLRTVNHLPTDSYLLGVVPRESPASWGALGDGRGMHALRAQAVAARSYATAENRMPGIAKTCDTISCQVYGGRAEQLAGSSFKDLEGVPTFASSDRAIAETSGQIRRMSASNAVARTEFSSSTGGHTAGGVFPAVPDDGDDIGLNPNHDWTARVAVATIEAKYGKGTLLDVQVVERNGLGADGGRALKVRLAFSGGTVERSGNEFRSDFGLKSDWFRLAGGSVSGYHALTRDGGVFSFGTARFAGSLPGLGVRTPARDLAHAPGGGYWVLADDGGVFTFGAAFHGSLGAVRLNGPPRQIVATPAGGGYWIVADDGGVFTFGDAGFFGSTGAMRLNAPVVGMAPTPSGGGYWLVARDGGVFTFGDAAFHGSTGAIRLNRPVTDIAANAGGNGYWLLGEDGGLFAFGASPFFGSLPGRKVVETAVDLDAAPTGGGYLIATSEGGVHAFGDAGFLGSPAGVGARSPTIAVGVPR